ncbi:hypothetical protein K466DRAFT_607619 [Polyporus arcularius HHB13444]|uniref:Uncharacterized protein n=1 Tax=Polyporus arcularius HHB13444 TaxID=1314778 RepID=A0A5C3NNI2_9APHY|nr:hypothetical protein K466DRAFT_607619 [Polyporus arcularius HHB13444]
MQIWPQRLRTSTRPTRIDAQSSGASGTAWSRLPRLFLQRFFIRIWDVSRHSDLAAEAPDEDAAEAHLTKSLGASGTAWSRLPALVLAVPHPPPGRVEERRCPSQSTMDSEFPARSRSSPPAHLSAPSRPARMIAFWTSCAEQDAHMRSGPASVRTSTLRPSRVLLRGRDGVETARGVVLAATLHPHPVHALRAGSDEGRTRVLSQGIGFRAPGLGIREFSSSSPAHLLSESGDATRAGTGACSKDAPDADRPWIPSF